MLASTDKKSCGDCSLSPRPRLLPSGTFGGLVLAILPKCPFCFVAFSGTALLCTDAEVATATHTVSSTPTILITSIISLIVLISVASNFNRSKTPRALLVLLPGIMAVVYSATWGGGEWLYYAGVCIMFLGIWLNGSFNYFFRRIRRIFYPENLTPLQQVVAALSSKNRS
jgi:hypothetical protein